MTQEDIIRMAREVGFVAYGEDAGEYRIPTPAFHGRLKRFASLVAAAEREKLTNWMWSLGYATGHGDTIEDLLDHLGTQISEGLEVEVLMEREACADICDGIIYHDGKEADRCAAAIRARSKE
jgi:hypothetical protein